MNAVPPRELRTQRLLLRAPSPELAAASASCARRISSLAAKSSPKRTSRRLLAITKTYAAAW